MTRLFETLELSFIVDERTQKVHEKNFKGTLRDQNTQEVCFFLIMFILIRQYKARAYKMIFLIFKAAQDSFQMLIDSPFSRNKRLFCKETMREMNYHVSRILALS